VLEGEEEKIGGGRREKVKGKIKIQTKKTHTFV